MTLLRRIYELLNRDLTGRTWTEKRPHAFFNNLVYFGSKRPDRSYWEGELVVPNTEQSIGATMQGTGQGPTDQEIAFCKWAVSSLDSIFEQSRELVAPEFLKWAKSSLPDDWKSEFELDGFQVPASGDRFNDWDITYFVSRAGHWFTVSFERGAPIHVSVDG